MRHPLKYLPATCQLVFCLIMTTEGALAEDYPVMMSFRDVMHNEDIALGEVSAIIQDHEGFIWLGGRNRLLRYDGYEFLPVHLRVDADSPDGDMIVHHVRDFLEDSHNDLWVATGSGLLRLDRNANVVRRLKQQNGQPLAISDTINRVIEAPTGEILAASYAGLAIIEPDTLNATVLIHEPGNPDSLSSNAIYDIAVDSFDNIWLATETGITRLNWHSRQFTHFVPFPDQPNSLPDNSIREIELDRHGNLWAGVSNGIYRFNRETHEFKRYRHDPGDPHSLAHDETTDLFVDSNGWLWHGSDRGGLSLYDYGKDRFIRFQHQAGQPGTLSSNTIRRIYEDSAGDMWVGTYPSGVNFHDSSSTAVTVYNHTPGLAQGLLINHVESVVEDKHGNLWIGAGGITRLDRDGVFTHYVPGPKGKSDITATAMISGLIDSDGDIWFGTWGGGFGRYNPATDRFEQIPFDATLAGSGRTTSSKLNDSVVWDIYEDRQKNLWIATHNGGLSRFDKHSNTFTVYEPVEDDSSSLSNKLVWTTYEDSRGRFWVGTARGLNVMDRERGIFKRYLADEADSNGLAADGVLSIFEDSMGRVWFGTDLGLHLYHDESDSFSVYDTDDGLADSGIRSIVEDKSGNLWLGTNNGVVMFNPDSRKVINYQSYNGKKLGGFATGAAVATSRNEMVFGGVNGLRIFNVQELGSDTHAPSVVLTDFAIFTKSVLVNGPESVLSKVINQAESVTLDYKKTMFSFKFAALDFRDPGKSQYAYKLEGFDDAWREVGNQRTATYTNISPGTYTFRIRAIHGNGEWVTKDPPLTITIKPPPWHTWWAYFGYVGIVGGVIYLRSEHRRLRQSAESYKTQSITDPLTALYNRAGIAQITGSLFASAEACRDTAVMVMDIDHFKRINDSCGHDAGDRILKGISSLVVQNLRHSDYVGRWGGEEFILICPRTAITAAPAVADKLRDAVAKHSFEVEGVATGITVSIGVAVTEPDETFEAVLKRADSALYQAKSRGRNCVGVA